MTYASENGFRRETLEMINKCEHCYHHGIVEMEDGRVFMESRCYNDNVKPCYEVLTSKETGVRYNVNLNNGMAYWTNL